MSKREPRPIHLNIKVTTEVKDNLNKLADKHEKSLSRVAYEILRDATHGVEDADLER